MGTVYFMRRVFIDFFNELLINHEDRKLWERMAQISKEQCREGITVFLCLFLFMSLLDTILKD